MSSSSNFLKTPPAVYCHCGELANVKISCTDRNPGRRFYNCKIEKKRGGCNYFRWYDDDDFSSPEKRVICGLLKRVKILERDQARKNWIIILLTTLLVLLLWNWLQGDASSVFSYEPSYFLPK